MSRRHITGAERLMWLGVWYYAKHTIITGLAFGVGRLTARRRARTI
jgi:hypothetical protein